MDCAGGKTWLVGAGIAGYALLAACSAPSPDIVIAQVVPSSVSASALPTRVSVRGSHLVGLGHISLDEAHNLNVATARVNIGGVELMDVQRASDSELVATIPATLAVGVHDVEVSVGEQQRASLPGGFTVLAEGIAVPPEPSDGCSPGTWGVAEPIWADLQGPDFGPALSADRLTLVFSRELSGQRELHVARRSDVAASFGRATRIGELAGGNNTTPVLSSDGLRLYFASDRNGSWDLWEAARFEQSSSFGDLHALSEINSSAADSRPWLVSDELTLYFESDRNSATGYDVWQVTRPSLTAPFGAPTLVPGLASPWLEGSPSLTPDGLTLYYTSDAPEGDGRRRLRRTSRLSRSAPFTSGNVVETLSRFDMTGASYLSADGRELVFSASDGVLQRLWRVIITCTDRN